MCDRRSDRWVERKRVKEWMRARPAGLERGSEVEIQKHRDEGGKEEK